jgi:hypothetical protein
MSFVPNLLMGIPEMANMIPGLRDLFGTHDTGAWNEKPPRTQTQAAPAVSMPASGGLRRVPTAVPYEKPSGMERAVSLIAPFIQAWAMQTSLRTASQRRRAFVPLLLGAGVGDLFNVVSFGRQQRILQEQARQAQAAQELARQYTQAQIEELGKRHLPEPKTPARYVENPFWASQQPGGAEQRFRTNPVTGQVEAVQLPGAPPIAQQGWSPQGEFTGVSPTGELQGPQFTTEEGGNAPIIGPLTVPGIGPSPLYRPEAAPKPQKPVYERQVVRDANNVETDVLVDMTPGSRTFGQPFVSTPRGLEPFTGALQRKPRPTKPAQPKRGTPAQFEALRRWQKAEYDKAEAAFRDPSKPQYGDLEALERQKDAIAAAFADQQLALGGGPNPGEKGSSQGPQKGERRTYQGVPYVFDGRQWVQQ